MRLTIGVTCAGALLIGSVAGHLGGQDASPAPPGSAGAPAGGAGRGAGRGFPAQQRQLADQATRDRGKLLSEINCRSCHGADLRGGETGGPNLLRSQLALTDLHGELIIPVVQQGRQTPGMPAMPAQPLPDADIVAVAEYIHAVQATSRGQGAPPAGPPIQLNIVVGDPKAGEAFVTGEHIVTARYGQHANWARGLRPTGVVEPNPGKEATIPGSLVSPIEQGVTNWPPAAYSPDTGLFYVQEKNGYNIVYLTDPDPRGSMGLGGKTVAGVGSAGEFLDAIEPTTGKTVWRHEFPSGIAGGGVGTGALVTAGGVLFFGDASGNFIGFDASTGTPLWHTRVGNISNSPQTYTVDGKQHVLVAVGDTLYAFKLY